jgi:hypothetical protein
MSGWFELFWVSLLLWLFREASATFAKEFVVCGCAKAVRQVV